MVQVVKNINNILKSQYNQVHLTQLKLCSIDWRLAMGYNIFRLLYQLALILNINLYQFKLT